MPLSSLIICHFGWGVTQSCVQVGFFLFIIIKVRNTFWSKRQASWWVQFLSEGSWWCELFVVFVHCHCDYCYATTQKQNAVVSQSEQNCISYSSADWGSAGRFIMQGCHWAPAIQEWTNNKSFVLQLGRINEVLLNMDISLSLNPTAVQCKSSTDLYYLCKAVGHV